MVLTHDVNTDVQRSELQRTDDTDLVHAPGPHVSGVHPGSAGSLVELHHLLPLLEEPEEGRDAAHVKNVRPDAHDVVEDPGQLPEQDADVLGPQGNVDVEELLHGEAVALLIAHHAHVVQAVEVWQSLRERMNTFPQNVLI